MITKADILAEIVRTAVDNGGVPLGHRAFEKITGIRQAEWFGIYWRAWGEAVRDAGFTPNTLAAKTPDEELLERYCLLTRECGRFPTKADFRLKKRNDSAFPNDVVLTRRFGSFPGARAAALEFARARTELADVTRLLEEAPVRVARADTMAVSQAAMGFVYLLKHGSRSEYKIGKTYNPLRREGEIRIQLPEKLAPVHYIETDDPPGVEAYWHARFATKRKEGEWFALTRDDVAAFKRWRRIA